ncbi:MAG: hypothetical protein A2X94_06400 [Bdellovibrionales bacterium GWB1_55_8]|nr:MAG: hypothetical protein A2X94_06400 [Bdellovibrionales bacterium GWB1_55_8]
MALGVKPVLDSSKPAVVSFFQVVKSFIYFSEPIVHFQAKLAEFLIEFLVEFLVEQLTYLF